MPRRTLLVVLIVGLVVIVLSTAALARVVIRTSGNTWSPARVTVVRGTRVVWRATTGNHNVTAYGGNWTFSRAISASGDPTAVKRFRTAGRFRFRCTIHSTIPGGVCNGMCGRVRVTA